LTTTASLLRTPLHSLHTEHNARMVPFAGYEMPVQFEGLKSEHLHTRQAAGLFDVSHMGQVVISGDTAAEALEELVPVDLIDLAEYRQLYTQLLNHEGGIIDDLMITRWPGNRFFLVVNAACKVKDLAWLTDNLGGVTIETLDNQALVALQGPAAADVLAELIPESHPLKFMHGIHARYNRADIFLTRSGYTGEDGFEISLPASVAETFCRQLLAYHDVKPVGLGARDTLRLEAGLCLYGHDLDETVTPVSAALTWSISKARRQDGARPGGYPGADRILEQMAKGCERRRVGIHVNGRAPVREGATLLDDNHIPVGHVTSGTFGPSVDAPIAMGYVDSALAKPGTNLFAVVRDRPLPVTVATLPFILHRYVRCGSYV